MLSPTDLDVKPQPTKNITVLSIENIPTNAAIASK